MALSHIGYHANFGRAHIVLRLTCRRKRHPSGESAHTSELSPAPPPGLRHFVTQGLYRAFATLFSILIRLAPFFFIFSAGTNAHYVNSAVQTGQAKYNATGRGFVIAHVRAPPDLVVKGPRYVSQNSGEST